MIQLHQVIERGFSLFIVLAATSCRKICDKYNIALKLCSVFLKEENSVRALPALRKKRWSKSEHFYSFAKSGGAKVWTFTPSQKAAEQKRALLLVRKKRRSKSDDFCSFGKTGEAKVRTFARSGKAAK
jgi:predicted DNA-binding WGR domain protein